MGPSPVQHEHRAAQRFPVQLPVTLRVAADLECVGITQDVSARGAFIFTDMKVAEAATLEFTLVLPPEVTLTESMHVRCRGKAVRVEGPGIGGKFGVAVAIENYEFLSEITNQPRPVARANGTDDSRSGREHSLRAHPSRA